MQLADLRHRIDDRNALVLALQDVIGPDRVFSHPADLIAYEYDGCNFMPALPDLVVSPRQDPPRRGGRAGTDPDRRPVRGAHVRVPRMPGVRDGVPLRRQVRHDHRGRAGRDRPRRLPAGQARDGPGPQAPDALPRPVLCPGAGGVSRDRSAASQGRIAQRLRGLVGQLGEVRARVTYQDPCHLVHGQGIRRQPRELLHRIPGLELVEMAGSDRCCGSTGIYNLTQPGYSRIVLEEKLTAIRDTGAHLVVAPNAGCMLQIASGIRAHGMPVHVHHLIDLLDRAYAAAEAPPGRSPGA